MARFARPSPTAVADPKCARGGGVSHILAEKRGVSFTLLKNMHENSIFLPIMEGGGRRPGTPYVGSATVLPFRFVGQYRPTTHVYMSRLL